MMYCIDTSAWLEGWSRYYPPDVFPSLWERLSLQIEAGVLKCPDEVYVELKKKDDGLHDWLRERKAVFVPIDTEIQEIVVKLLAEFPRLVDTHRNRSQADPFVIATSICLGSGTVVVTEETRRGKLDTPKIPDVCDVREIRCFTFLDMIRDLGWRF